MTVRLIAAALLISSAVLSAQPPVPPPVAANVAPRTLSQTWSARVSSARTIDELTVVLAEAYRTFYSSDDDAVPDLHGKTKGFLTLAKPFVLKKQNTADAHALFSACSLSTLAAVMQLVQARYDRDLRQLREQRDNTQRQIKAARQRICELEMGKGTGKPDSKFSTMESPQIQVSNESRGTVISVSDILFKTDSAALTPDLATSLTKFAEILHSSGEYKVTIEGHTDNRGPEAYNQALSEQRAENVMKFLLEKGIAAGRLSAAGFGMTRPIADNETAAGRKKNRRVDLVVSEAEYGADSTAAGVK